MPRRVTDACRRNDAPRRWRAGIVLASRPRLLRRFETLLAFAQRYAIVREEQAGWFTLGWPVMRRAALRLGDELRRQGVIKQAEDIFFLTYTEVIDRIEKHGLLGGDASSDLHDAVAVRRQDWRRQRRLTPPSRRSVNQLAPSSSPEPSRRCASAPVHMAVLDRSDRMPRTLSS